MKVIEERLVYYISLVRRKADLFVRSFYWIRKKLIRLTCEVVLRSSRSPWFAVGGRYIVKWHQETRTCGRWWGREGSTSSCPEKDFPRQRKRNKKVSAVSTLRDTYRISQSRDGWINPSCRSGSNSLESLLSWNPKKGTLNRIAGIMSESKQRFGESSGFDAFFCLGAEVNSPSDWMKGCKKSFGK